MTIPGGSRLGPYRIVESIGAGGMGEVYRAVDTRLDRPVAVKVLPPHLSAAPGMRERFEREARTISALSHPNICSLFDVGRDGEVDYLVMELLEGHTLAERIARGTLPMDELLRYGLEIVSALDKAHRQKIIHRDLKPGNVFLTRSGAKLLDFGLAKFSAPANIAPNAPTEVLQQEQPLTAAGSLVGTVPYMSPEQLEGKEVDERSDLFAFGAILYEMATGKRPFAGNSQASLIASILEHEPQAVSALRPSVPQSLDRLIRACLEKDPENRVQSAHDVKLQLQWISASSGMESLPAPSRRRWSRVVRSLPWFLAAAALAGLGLATWRARSPVEAPVEFALRAPGQEGVFGVFPAVSPDGTGYSEPWLLFVRKGTLFAERFDAEDMKVHGNAVPVADHVAHSSIWMHSGSAVSARTLIYPPAVTHERTIRWLDRSGHLLGIVFQGSDISLAALAPDDSRILYFKEDRIAGDTTLWTYDPKRAIESKLTTIHTTSASWSLDGKLIAHDAGSGGATGIQVQPSDGSLGARPVGTTGGTNEFVGSWVSDREVLVERYTAETFFDLWRVPIDGAPPAPLLATEFNEYGARLSPDRKWVAFESSRSGRGEIFVRNLSSGETIQISNRGGGGPEWSRHEIFFIDDAGDLQAVPYTLTPTSLEPGAPQRLFAFPKESFYDVTLDGQRILLSAAYGQAGQRESLHVLMGWKSRLSAR